ncbi:MAG: XisI protein [Anaerolineae bacterium]|nr:XisI protein [Anaerolineae bacterium]
MDSLKEIVLEAMSGYAVKGLNGFSVLTMSADHSVFTIISTATVKGKRTTTASLIVHLDNEHIFIDHDINNKPLVDALVQAGIPRQSIILAYAGEPVPESV